MEPLVSILIPAYNAEPWIAETINSALGQTWSRKELIIVDDGSTDRTLSIARRFASAQVSVVSQPHHNAAAARNTALSICQGDYIQWLDADDLLAPDKIVRQLDALRGCPSTRRLLSCEWGHFIYRSHKTTFIPTPLWCDLSRLEWLLRKLDLNLHMPLSTWLVSRELTEAAGPWDIRLSLDDDGEYFCRVLVASDGTHFVPQARAFYRRAGLSSLSNVGRSDRALESQFLSMQLHIAAVRSLDDSPRVRRACLKYLQRWLIYFYPERHDIVHRCQQLADTLGGRLEVPCLPWKYAWIQRAFGWGLAKQAWRWMPQLRSSVVRAWDRTLFALEQRHARASK
jgi:glycosyltransferase involved in cell wall biosynthesis